MAVIRCTSIVWSRHQPGDYIMESDNPAKYVGIIDVDVCLRVFKSKTGNDIIACALEIL